MLRTALRPRWVALLVVVLLAATVMSFLGQWQLGRARERSREPAEQAEQARRNAVPKRVAEVLAPRQTFPREAVDTKVSVSGTWAPDEQLLVADRQLGDRSGFWVLLPVVLADGSAVPVVRGWVGSATDPAAVAPRGEVEVVGLLQPSEPPSQRAPGEATALPVGQIERVAVADLVTRWSQPLITGFVVQESEAPVAAAVPTPVPPPVIESGWDLQNLSYAVQWWLFAAFGLFLWWRLVRDDHRGLLRPTAESESESESESDSGSESDSESGSEPESGSELGVGFAPEPGVPDDLSSLSGVPDRQAGVLDRKIGPKNP